MDTQRAIEKLLQNFTKELMKVFSESVVRAVAQVTNTRPSGGSRASLPSSSAPAAPARRAGAARKAAPKGKPGRPPKTAKPAASKGGAKVEKSSPAEVDELSNDIINVLRRSDKNLAAREIMEKLNFSALDAGRFNYALGKLKDDGRVAQHGDRRMARYGVGNGGKAKPARGRKPKAAEAAPVSEAPAEVPAEG